MSEQTVVSVGGSAEQKVDPLTLTWQNVSVHVVPPKSMCGTNTAAGAEGRAILDNVSGAVTPGTLLAVVGSSGAGKSTLLNVLNRRNMSGMKVTGDIRINGQEIGDGLARYVGYVQQFDMAIGTLKVREHLQFQARTRMDKNVSDEEKKRRVEIVMRQMGLSKCANTLIGIPGVIKGISGGERRRLAFASELLTNPSLLFCDEPTSGLDSYMAQNVVLSLKDLAARGHSVICVIHQPSSEVFALFDRILILADGRVCFMGSTSEALDFFKRCGHPCPVNFNPADHFILTLAVVPGREKQCREVVKYFCDSYKKSDECLREKKAIESAKQSGLRFSEMPKKFAKCSPYKATWMQQASAIYWRCMVSTLREPAVLWSRFVPVVGQMIMVTILYARQSYDQEGVDNLNGALFLMQTQMTFGFVWSIISTFPLEFPIFLKEHHDGMYGVGVYFICKMLAELPQFVILPIIWCTPLYWAVGFETTARGFFIALSVNIIISNVAVSFGYMLSCMSSDLSVLMSMAPIFLVPIMITGGYFINIESLPTFLAWSQWLSWYRYGNEILVVNQWKHAGNITCDADTVCVYETGQDVIDFYSFDEDSIAENFALLIVLLVGYRLISYVLLYIRSRKSFKIRKPTNISADDNVDDVIMPTTSRMDDVARISGVENGSYVHEDGGVSVAVKRAVGGSHHHHHHRKSSIDFIGEYIVTKF